MALPVLSGGLYMTGTFGSSGASEYDAASQDGMSDQTICAQIESRIQTAAYGGALSRHDPYDDTGSALRAVATLSKHRAEWSRRDCDRYGRWTSRDAMTSYGSGRSGDELRIRPGKPMLDPRPPSERW